jgi:uncharacterized protein DUF2399
MTSAAVIAETSTVRGVDETYAAFAHLNAPNAPLYRAILATFVAERARFDGEGIEIARSIIMEHGASPWRMDVNDYLVAPKGHALTRPPLATPWCPALAEAMREVSRVGAKTLEGPYGSTYRD